MHKLSPSTPVLQKSATYLIYLAWENTDHSVACQDNNKDAARTASELCGEKPPMASCKPLRAIPRCS